MSSLSVHLRRAEDHSGLPFHPSCPVCRRDRLSGSLDGDELVSRRTQAALAVGVLAFSAVGAPAAVAAGPDTEVEGSAEVVESGASDSLDLGEATVPLTDAGAAAPEDDAVEVLKDGADDDVNAVEPLMETAGVAAGPVADTAEEVAEPEPEPVALAAPPVEVPVATPAPDSGGSVGPRVDRAAETERERPRVESGRESVKRTVVVAPVGAPAGTDDSGAVAPAVPVGTATRAPVAIRAVAGTSSGARGGKAAAGDRVHVVQRGESLWSIAADVLGERAGVGRIAREVNRLWALNEDRIASGDPDLLYAGTRLRLR
jgi:nucleoid-associated protein YgaU